MSQLVRYFVILGLAASAALAWATVVHAQVYRWVDPDGRVHYSDQPPPGARQYEQLRGGRPAAPEAAPENQAAETPAPPSYQEQDAEFRRRQVERAERAAQEQKAREEAAVRQRQCSEARNQLAALQSGQRIARFNAQGEREILDEAQMAAELERARKAVAGLCN